jgi:nitroreductase
MDTGVLPPERLTAPRTDDAREVAVFLVASAVWAPSLHNTQPWSFAAAGQEISLYADGSRMLPAADPSGREMMISCGAALFTARLALRSLGWIPQVEVLPDPAQPLLAARLTWRQRAMPAGYELRLFGEVLKRRTHRGGFGPLPLAPRFLEVLQANAARDGAALRIVADQGHRAVLAAAVQSAEQSLRWDSRRVRELAAWTPSPGTVRLDGLPPSSYPAHPPRTFPDFPSRDFAHGHGWGIPASSASAAARSAGVVCLLATERDQPADWLNAGQALQRVLLTSSACGVAAALHSQPLELPWLRDTLRSRLCGGSYPQMVLRLGTVTQTATSVRRPPASVLRVMGGHSSGSPG